MTLRSETGLRPSLHMPAPHSDAGAKQGETALESASQRRNRAKHGEALSRENARERNERDATETQPRLSVVPCKRAEAAAFIKRYHRHHPPSVGDVFCLAVADEDGEVRGVAQVGRPVARHMDDAWTLEVTRVATDGCSNACSALYGAAWRAARALGWRRLVTYTLQSESGSSLRAAGWQVIGERKARSWSEASRLRPRVDTNAVTGQGKLLWEAA